MPRSRTRSDTDSDYAPSPSPKKAKSKPTTKAAASTQSNSTTPSKTAKKKATTAEGNTTVAKKWPPIPPLPLLSPAETKLKYPHVTIINGKVYAPATGWTCPHPNCWHWLADSVPRKDKQRHRESHKDLCAGCNKPQCVASIKVHYARKHPGLPYPGRPYEPKPFVPTEDEGESSEEGGAFACEFPGCAQSFSTRLLLQHHYASHRVDCHVCGINLSIGGTWGHYRNRHPHCVNPWSAGAKKTHKHRCVSCPDSFEKRGILVEHSRLYHDQVTCNVCGDNFSGAAAAEVHKKAVHDLGPDTIYIPHCCQVWRTWADYRRHQEATHNIVASFTCEGCDAKFWTLLNHDDHAAKCSRNDNTYQGWAQREFGVVVGVGLALGGFPEGVIMIIARKLGRAPTAVLNFINLHRQFLLSILSDPTNLNRFLEQFGVAESFLELQKKQSAN